MLIFAQKSNADISIMSNIGDRLRKFADYKKEEGISYSTFAEILEMCSQRLSALFTGKRFGIKVVEVLMRKFPELNVRWLILGEGEMLSKEYREEKELELRKKLSSRLKETELLLPYLSPKQLQQINSGGLLSDEEIKSLKDKIGT